LESFPPAGGVLMVSNHSGGLLTPDVLVLAPAFYDKFGYDRPLYTLAHYGVFFTPFRGYLSRIGVIHASPENAGKALHSGAVVLVYPGGDYDAYRPTLGQNLIDFEGRTRYARIAIETGVPIVPVVSIGGQENPKPNCS
jgi:1-acyl-sn-glycerol-3-phosphate acyltransferase